MVFLGIVSVIIMLYSFRRTLPHLDGMDRWCGIAITILFAGSNLVASLRGVSVSTMFIIIMSLTVIHQVCMAVLSADD